MGLKDTQPLGISKLHSKWYVGGLPLTSGAEDGIGTIVSGQMIVIAHTKGMKKTDFMEQHP